MTGPVERIELVRPTHVTPAVQQYVLSALIDNEVIEDLAAETGFVWVQVDQEGRRAIGIRVDGTVDIPKLLVGDGTIAPEALSDDIVLPEEIPLDSGYAYVWTDSEDRAALWIRPDGKVGFAGLDTATKAKIAPAEYISPEGAVRKITSGPDIVCWGDSMTAGAGSTTAAGSYTGFSGGYPTVLATLTGRTVRNAGVGGETSVTITARSGATPFLALPTGGSIPASGGVTITFSAINGTVPVPLLQGTGTPGSTFSGTLAGVPGTITQSGGVYTFTRTAAGSAVAVTRPAPFRTDFSQDRRGDVVILWLGQNGPSNARAIADAQAIVEHLTALNKRYLVISRPSSTDADDAAWHDAFGRRFIAARKYLVDYGLADAGITPTAQDNTDIAAGTVPTSLRIDGTHWNAAGYSILANLIDARLRELGWI